MNKPFLEMLQKMEAIHNKKSADYAKDTNLYSNFEFSGMLASKFRHPVDISMAALIGTKLERLSNLLDTGRTPNNESVEDNFLDLCTYMTLWAAYRSYKAQHYKPLTAATTTDPLSDIIAVSGFLNLDQINQAIDYLRQSKELRIRNKE